MKNQLKILFNFLFILGILLTKLADANNVIQIQKIRVIKNYVNHVMIQCPVNGNLVRAEHIKWVNERYDFNKPDEEVLISSQNLLSSGQLNYQLQDGLHYFSCGYILNNCYVRVKLWQIDYVCKIKSIFLYKNRLIINYYNYFLIKY